MGKTFPMCTTPKELPCTDTQQDALRAERLKDLQEKLKTFNDVLLTGNGKSAPSTGSWLERLNEDVVKEIYAEEDAKFLKTLDDMIYVCSNSEVTSKSSESNQPISSEARYQSKKCIDTSCPKQDLPIDLGHPGKSAESTKETKESLTNLTSDQKIVHLANALYTTLGILESVDKTTSKDIEDLVKSMKDFADKTADCIEALLNVHDVEVKALNERIEKLEAVINECRGMQA